jgi:hypothetical protein
MLIKNCPHGERVLVAVTSHMFISRHDTGEYLECYADYAPSFSWGIFWRETDTLPHVDNWWAAIGILNDRYTAGWWVDQDMDVYPLKHKLVQVQAKVAIKSGAHCASCHDYNEYADAYARFVCYSCRSSGRK